MDGVGIGKNPKSDYVKIANTPNLDRLHEVALYTQLKAHGTAVGLPDDGDMGNSEVGHNAIGCGRVFAQGAALVGKAIESGSMFEGEVWKALVSNVKEKDSSLHFIGLFSDGNVHSNLNHLEAMLRRAKAEGVKKARVHALIDGRDVPPTSALEYVERFEKFLDEINADGSVDYCVASGGGRMNITMDRYDADWTMVARGWKAHVKAEGRSFSSMREAIETFRAETPGILDQDLPPFVIERNGVPTGPIVDGDSVVFFNFRGDRALEITKAFEAEELSEFDRGPKPDVLYAGMMQYDGDLKVPEHYLVSPPAIDRTMSEYLSNVGVTQLAISETQKFGHVTYFFNGNKRVLEIGRRRRSFLWG
jgi:2,3-bisphosphoglycerate-independent phosphoglycerate mutase